MAEQYVGIDLHRRRSMIVCMTPGGEVLETIRIDNDPVALSLELAKAGPDPEVVLEATYGWYWAADLLQACGARVHLAHPLGVKMFGYQRVKTDARDSTDESFKAGVALSAGWDGVSLLGGRGRPRSKSRVLGLGALPRSLPLEGPTVAPQWWRPRPLLSVCHRGLVAGRLGCQPATSWR
jgi:hypothetical protein